MDDLSHVLFTAPEPYPPAHSDPYIADAHIIATVVEDDPVSDAVVEALRSKGVLHEVDLAVLDPVDDAEDLTMGVIPDLCVFYYDQDWNMGWARAERVGMDRLLACITLNPVED